MKMNGPHPVCGAFGDRIGVYEPIWLERTDGTLTRSSLLVIQQAARNASRLYHVDCVAPTQIPEQSAA